MLIAIYITKMKSQRDKTNINQKTFIALLNLKPRIQIKIIQK